MSGIRITQLPEKLTAPEQGDFFVIDDGLTAQKVDFDTLAASVVETYETTLAGETQTVKGAIDALEADKEEVDTNGVYLHPSNNRAWYIKKHGFVHVWGNPGNLSFYSDQWSNLGVTLPTGYRPTGLVYAPCIFGNNGETPGLIRVGTDGVMQCYVGTTISSKLVVFNFMYAVAS